MSKTHRLKALLKRRKRPVVISVIVLSVIGVSLRYNLLPAEYTLANDAGLIGWGIYILFEWIRGRGEGPTPTLDQLKEAAVYGQRVKHELEEESKKRDRLNEEKRAHHKDVVGSFFNMLLGLGVYYSTREAFHISLLVAINPPLYKPLSELPCYAEAMSHLKDEKYSSFRDSLDKLLATVSSYNDSADVAMQSSELETKLQHRVPGLRPLTANQIDCYDLDKVWFAVDYLMQNPEGKIGPDRMAFGTAMVVNGTMIAYCKKIEDSTKLEEIMNETVPRLRSLSDSRARTVLECQKLLGSFKDEAKGFLKEFGERKWLFGRCDTEGILEDQARVLAGGT